MTLLLNRELVGLSRANLYLVSFYPNVLKMSQGEKSC